jgi:type I restriction enzyme S subunit
MPETKGHSFRGKIPEDENGNVSVVNASNIDELNGIDYDGLKRTNLENSKRTEEIEVRELDILCVSTGPRLYSCVAKGVKGRVVPTTHLTLIRAEHERVLPEYLSWFINNSQKYYLLNAQGSSVKNISTGTLKSLPVDLPPIEEQKRIVDLNELLKEEEKLMTKLLENRKALIGEIQRCLSSGKLTIK